MNVIFLNNIFNTIPQRTVGPYIVKHYLKKRGYSAQVIDYVQEMTSAELVKYIEKFIDSDTMCIAMSSTFWPIDITDWPGLTADNGTPPHIYHAVSHIKNKYPSIKIILGGAQSPFLRNRIDIVDAIFVGECEDLLPDYLDYLRGTGPKPNTTINPVTRKEIFRYPINNNFKIENCDFLWQKEDCVVEGETLPLETARGCIFKCRFCAYPHLGKKKLDYIKPMDTLKSHLLHNWENFKVKNYFMLDDTFNDSEYKIDSFLALTKELPFTLNYAAYLRADLIHRFTGMAEKLLESGLSGAFFGLESIHPYASTIVGKGWSGKEGKFFIPTLVNEIWNKRVSVVCGLIAGLPGESRDNLEETIRWANEHFIHVIFSGLRVSNNTSDKTFTSVFEREADKYTFKFDSNNEWYNELWNRKTAQIAANDLNGKRSNRRVICFNNLALRSLGYTFDEINAENKQTLVDDNPEFARRKAAFLQNYKSKLDAL